MARIKITLPDDKFEVLATLNEIEAPKTCKGVLASLPIEGRLIHAMNSGSEVLIFLPKEKMLKIDQENQVTRPIPGDMTFYYSLWGNGAFLKDNKEASEITFVYGRNVSLRNNAQQDVAANLFGTIENNLTQFADICRRIRYEGPKRIRLEQP